uniref:ShKT domain-containing protein n=1 Tax=Meloidogyne enterolobii TaxID=390850 RepID=A0A6V7TY12_MELEN|nr:unnamed protein product [Meloidogyne enterolobii]
MLAKLLLNFYFNLIFNFNFFLVDGLDVDNGFYKNFNILTKINFLVDVINLLKNTQDPYKVFHLKKGEKFTREDLENNYETVKQLIEATENEEDKDEALKKLDEFKEKLVEKAIEKEGPGDAEPEEEEVAENHEGPEQPSGEATENSKETKEEEGEDGPKEHVKEEKEGEEEGPKHEESGETPTKETEEEQKEPKIEEDKGKENEDGPKIKEKKKKPGKAEKKEKAEKEKTKKETKEASKGKISKEKAKVNEGNEGINSHSNSVDSSASSEDQFEDGPDIVKRPPVGSEELPSEKTVHWPETEADEKRRRERKEEKERRERNREEEEDKRSRQNRVEPEENSDESGPKLVEESESSESPEDKYERRSKEREQLTYGYTSTFCKKYIHRCYIEEYMTEMTTHCKDICDLLGTLNVDIGLNCEELALSGLCSDGMWGDKMDKYCHRSCTSLRGKR